MDKVIKSHASRLKKLEEERQPFEEGWQKIAKLLAPNRYTTDGTFNPMPKLYDSTGIVALRTTVSGLREGMTSPARQWFSLKIRDEQFSNNNAVSEILSEIKKRLMAVFRSSNFYEAIHISYKDASLFSQSVSIIDEDVKDVIRLTPLTHGMFWLKRDINGEPVALYRKVLMSCVDIVQKFGINNIDKTQYREIHRAYDSGDYYKIFELYHAIEKRIDRDLASKHKKDKPYTSNYWIKGKKKLLSEGGYDENPIIAPAWELAPFQDYGHGAPAEVAYYDILTLEKMQKAKAIGVELMNDPVLVAPDSPEVRRAMINAKKQPGTILFVNELNQNASIRSLNQIRFPINELRVDLEELRQRIHKAFYTDLFMMLSNMEGVQPRSAYELSQRKEEKLLALGTVLQNMQNQQSAVIIDRTMSIMARRGLLPEMPPNMQGQDYEIEYNSMLAQAQQAVSTGAVERLLSFTGNLTAVNPAVIDNIDMDKAITEYGSMIGVTPSILRDKDDVEKIRAQRQQAQAQAQQAEQFAAVAPALNQSAQAAKVLTEVDKEGGVSELLNNIT